MSVDIATVRNRFKEIFGGPPDVVARAPGRVNIIGEHTDYNHGFALPMAIERETVIAARQRTDAVLDAFAYDLGARAQASLERRVRQPEAPWFDYVIGVADELIQLDRAVAGVDMVIQGDVPIGCGLSSSAALEMAALTMFETLGGYRIDGAEGPRLGQRVENRFLGLSTGIMDQFISRMGRAGHALFLDCRSLDCALTPVAFPAAVFVIANTGVTRGLTASKYNERVAECGEAVQAMRKALGLSGTHLRDFTLEHLAAARNRMREVAYRRACHILTENARTIDARDAMRAGDAARLGVLMNASDESLRNDYEVTCPQLDAMTRTARALPGCYGARMTGAGFGGCTIQLVARDRVKDFIAALLSRYSREMGLRGEALESSPADGASAVRC